MRQCITVISDIREWEFNCKYKKWAVADKFNLWKDTDKSIRNEDRTFIDGVVIEDTVRPQYAEEHDLRAINMVETLRSQAVRANIKAKFEKPNDPKKWRTTLRSWLCACGTGREGKSGHAQGTPEYPDYTLGHREALDGVQEAAKVIAKDAGC